MKLNALRAVYNHHPAIFIATANGGGTPTNCRAISPGSKEEEEDEGNARCVDGMCVCVCCTWSSSVDECLVTTLQDKGKEFLYIMGGKWRCCAPLSSRRDISTGQIYGTVDYIKSWNGGSMDGLSISITFLFVQCTIRRDDIQQTHKGELDARRRPP